MNDNQPGQGGTERRAQSLRGDDGTLGQIEMAGPPGQIRDDEWKKCTV